MSKQEQLQDSIESLRSALPEVNGALVATTDGLPMVQSLPGSADASRAAAMAASALSLGKRISTTLEIGNLRETTVRGSDGQLFLYSCGMTGVLAVLVPEEANVGLIHLEARNAAQDIARILTPVPTAAAA